MRESYKATIENKQHGEVRYSFYYLVHALIVSSKNIVTSVDYVQALLIQEPTMTKKSPMFLFQQRKRKILTSYLTAANSFPKYRYNHHVPLQNDDCVTHNLSYIIGRNSKFDSISKTHQKSGSIYKKCKFLSMFAIK